MYIDETGIDDQMYRQYAQDPREAKVKILISGKRHIRTGLVAVQCKGKLIAPLKYNGTIKSKLFENGSENDLLNELPSGSVLIMDNASFHRKDACIQ